MRVGAQLEAARHLFGELALTLARQPRDHFPEQGRGLPTGLGCRRSEPLLALSNRPTEFLTDRHKQSIRRPRRGRVRTKTSHPGKTEGGIEGQSSNSYLVWKRIGELHASRFG